MNKTVYKFDKENVNLNDFMYAYSPLPEEHRKFEFFDDCIANYPEDNPDDFYYVSIITKKKYKLGTKVSAKFSFDGDGAPLIVFTDDISENTDGTKLFGLHFECVAYNGGCNLWRIVPAIGQSRPISTTKMAFTEFEIAPGKDAEISATITEDSIGRRTLTVNVNGVVMGCMHVDFPEEFHVGITACEGPNRFYEMAIEK